MERNKIVSIIWKPIIITKPTLEELLEVNSEYFDRISQERGQEEATAVRNQFRQELREVLGNVVEGQIVEVPLVQIGPPILKS